MLIGCAFPEGATGYNIARQVALRAGCPVTVPAATINRFCSSGLQTIALAAQRIIAGEGEVYVAGGVESISCVQNESNKHMLHEPWLIEHKPAIYWSMLQTAETVAKRYDISRERQDEYGARSQQRAGAAAAAGKFDAEIVPMTVIMGVADKETRALSMKEVTIAADEGIRADTTLEAIAKIKPALPGGVVAAVAERFHQRARWRRARLSFPGNRPANPGDDQNALFDNILFRPAPAGAAAFRSGNPD